jgi:hypothetical protein
MGFMCRYAATEPLRLASAEKKKKLQLLFNLSAGVAEGRWLGGK